MEKKIIIEEHESFKEGSSKKHRNHRPFGGFHDELVEYVNEKGQSDAIIDIYKIEDDLYKLVVKR